MMACYEEALLSPTISCSTLLICLLVRHLKLNSILQGSDIFFFPIKEGCQLSHFNAYVYVIMIQDQVHIFW